MRTTLIPALRLGIVLLALNASAQNFNEFELPSFVSDAGTEVPPMPSVDALPPPILNPPLPPDSRDTLYSPPISARSEVPKQPEEPQKPPFWNTAAGSLSLLMVGNQMFYIGGDLSIYAQKALGVTRVVDTHSQGWLIMFGIQGGAGGVQLEVCGGLVLCAFRVSAGASVKFGWAEGTARRNGSTKADTMYFAQIDWLVGRFTIPPAPLTRTISSWEMIARLRIGFQGSLGEGLLSTLHLAGVLELIPLSNETKGVSFGISGGFAF